MHTYPVALQKMHENSSSPTCGAEYTGIQNVAFTQVWNSVSMEYYNIGTIRIKLRAFF
jgi:hypothetical protein